MSGKRPKLASDRFQALFDAGFNVIPLLHGDKKAAIKWSEFQERRATTEEIQAWSANPVNYNVGVVSGRTSQNRVFLDIDSEDARNRLEATYGCLPITPTVRTGKGWHLCLHDSSGQLRNFVGKAKDVDLRANGGYVVGVGSLHPSGALYEWMPGLSPEDVPVADLPKWLRELAEGHDPQDVTALPGSEKRPPPMRTGGATRAAVYAERALGYEVDRVRAARRGARNHTLNSSAFALGQLVGAGALDKGLVEDQLRSASISNGLMVDDGRESVAGTLNSGLTDGMANPRDLAHVEAQRTSENLTDYGNAERLIRRHGDDLRYCHPTRQWYVWDGTRWIPDMTGEVMRRAKESIRSIYSEVARCPDSDERKRLAQHATRSESESRLAAMIQLAGSELGTPILPEDLDRQPFLFNAANGTVDLCRTDEPLRAPDRADLLTLKSRVDYDAEATCPQFDAFLNQIMAGDAELIDYLQRLVGYALTGDVGEQALFLFHGTGANGKSTFLNVLQHVLGDYAMQAPSDLLLASRKDTHPTAVADLKGKRLVTAIETEARAKLAEALVKQLTGGDQIRARRMKENYFQFAPTHKLIMAVNHKPVVRGCDMAIWRRIHLVPFGVTIPTEDRDPRLLDKLKAEAPGILAWAVRGCQEWQASRGLGSPTAVTSATEGYRKEMDVLGMFIVEECVIEPHGRMRASALFHRYLEWCHSGKEDGMTQTEFGNELTARGYPSERRSGVVWRMGIQLRVQDDSGRRNDEN